MTIPKDIASRICGGGGGSNTNSSNIITSPFLVLRIARKTTFRCILRRNPTLQVKYENVKYNQDNTVLGIV